MSEGPPDASAELERLRREVRVLKKRLARSELNRRRLEDQRDRSTDQYRKMIVEMQIAQDALVLGRREAQQANRAKSAFLANMSHELRTPLTAISGYVEMALEDESITGDLREDLQQVGGAARHLGRVINSLLDMSKIEAGRMVLQLEAVDVGALIREVAGTVLPLMNEGRNELELELGEVPRLVSDSTRIRQILLNLLSNAAKFTRDGTVRCVLTSEPGGVVVAVSDTGDGLSDDDLRRVFAPFVQVDRGADRHRPGTGLGLAISDRLCVLLGGTLTARSTLGEGSTFTVRLPLESPVLDTGRLRALDRR